MEKITPEQAHRDVQAGAMLVCAYDDPEKCQKYMLEGAVSLADFQSREASLPRESELIFY